MANDKLETGSMDNIVSTLRAAGARFVTRDTGYGVLAEIVVADSRWKNMSMLKELGV